MQPHVIFPHNGNGVRLNLGGKSTRNAFTFPQKSPASTWAYEQISEIIRIFNMMEFCGKRFLLHYGAAFLPVRGTRRSFR